MREREMRERTPVEKALQQLLEACNLQGESGTEELFYMLQRATIETEHEIEESHSEGLCIDMTMILAEALERYIFEAHEPAKASTRGN